MENTLKMAFLSIKLKFIKETTIRELNKVMVNLPIPFINTLGTLSRICIQVKANWSQKNKFMSDNSSKG